MDITNSINKIKQWVDEGRIVYAKSSNYVVIKDKLGEYIIKCRSNNNIIGLHGKDGTKFEKKLNMRDFFTLGEYHEKSE